MKGYIIRGTDTKSGKEYYFEMDMSPDYVGALYATENPKDMYVYLDKKDAEEDLKYIDEWYETKVVELDLTSPFLPKELFGLDQIESVRQLCKDVETESDIIWRSNSDKISLICKQNKLLNRAEGILRMLMPGVLWV